MTRIKIIDSHTGGEPTRVVASGGPELGGGTMAERQESIVGRVFEGTVRSGGDASGKVSPTIKSSAFTNGEAELILDERDPLCYEIHQ